MPFLHGVRMMVRWLDPPRDEGEDAMFRRRRQDQEGGEPADQGARYLLREKLLSIGRDFWIENDRGERIFRVDAKVLRVRDTVLIKDTKGTELVKLQKRLLRARDTMAIERGDERLATVKKARSSTRCGTASPSTWPAVVRWRHEATSWTTSTRSPATASRSPTSPSAGSASATATAWRSHQARTTRSCWP
jgi:LURP-one-related